MEKEIICFLCSIASQKILFQVQKLGIKTKIIVEFENKDIIDIKINYHNVTITEREVGKDYELVYFIYHLNKKINEVATVTNHELFLLNYDIKM